MPTSCSSRRRRPRKRNDIETAQRLYRRVMRIDPERSRRRLQSRQPAARRSASKVEAEAAYRAATKADAGFAEAWYNLADMLDEQGRPTKRSSASSARSPPIRTTPTRSSISACCTSATNGMPRRRSAGGAISRWTTTRPGRARARQALKYCEMQIAHPRSADDGAIVAAREQSLEAGSRAAIRSRTTSASATSAAPRSPSRQAGVEAQGETRQRATRRAVRRAEARCAPRALRPAARARRHAEELGGDARTEPRRRREAARGAHRRSSDAVPRFRGQHPEGRVWRRRDDRVGSRALGAACSIPTRGSQKGHLEFTLHGDAPQGPLASGAHAAAARREDRAVAADQGRRRVRPAGRRARHHRRGDDLAPERPHHRGARRAQASCARTTPAAPR